MDAEEVFESERQLNTRIGARIVDGNQPEHTFWNFDESSTQGLLPDDSSEEFEVEVNEQKCENLDA